MGEQKSNKFDWSLEGRYNFFSIRSVHLLHRPCESDSSVSKFLSAKQIINEFAKYCEE